MSARIDYRKLLVILAAIALLAPLAASLGAASLAPSTPPAQVAKPEIEKYETTIASIANSTITVTKGGEAIELLAKGRWFLVTDELVRLVPWSEAASYIEEGYALVVAVTASRANKTVDVLLGLKQGDVALFRPILLRYWAKRHVHTKSYVSVRGQIAHKGSDYFTIEREGRRGLVVVRGEWLRAGGGEVTWEEVADEFRIGDTVRIFCHNVLIMSEDFAETFDIGAFIWGYSGAIIDLTSGVTISKA